MVNKCWSHCSTWCQPIECHWQLWDSVTPSDGILSVTHLLSTGLYLSPCLSLSLSLSPQQHTPVFNVIHVKSMAPTLRAEHYVAFNDLHWLHLFTIVWLSSSVLSRTHLASVDSTEWSLAWIAWNASKRVVICLNAGTDCPYFSPIVIWSLFSYFWNREEVLHRRSARRDSGRRYVSLIN